MTPSNDHMRKTIQAQFEEFMHAIFKGEKVDDIQLQEMRRAFYGGFAAAATCNATMKSYGDELNAWFTQFGEQRN